MEEAVSKNPKPKTTTFNGAQIRKDLETLAPYAESIEDPSIKESLQNLMRYCLFSCERDFTTCKNSSMPPSQNPNRPKQSKKGTSNRKTGGQLGHPGHTMPLETPDDEQWCKIDMDALPPGHTYTLGTEETRQVIEIECRRKVIHYHLEVVFDENGKRYVADCPKFAKTRLQYGNSVTAEVIELTCLQMLPLERTSLYMRELFNISISEGTLVNKRTAIANRLEDFYIWVRRKLIAQAVIHCDETGCNIDGKQMWLHTVCSEEFFFFAVSEKRGVLASNKIGVLPAYQGVLVHDCFSSYFTFIQCEHSVCGAHLIRELEGAKDRESYSWATSMIKFFCDANEAKQQALDAATAKGLPLDATTDFGNGAIDKETFLGFQKRYRHILGSAETACGLNHKNLLKGSTKLPAGTKTKNLVRRLRERETEVLLFLKRGLVPLTNNKAEQALRMTKVHEKVSGCCRSIKSAEDLAIIRSYLYTCRAHGISSRDAIMTLLDDRLPEFIDLNENLPKLIVIQPDDKSS